MRLNLAAPPVDRSSVWIDKVKRGGMLRDVRGQGTLVSEDLRQMAVNRVITAFRSHGV